MSANCVKEYSVTCSMQPFDMQRLVIVLDQLRYWTENKNSVSDCASLV